MCGVWHLFMEDYFLDKYAPQAYLTRLQYLQPFNTDEDKCWSSALHDKKVLVVHPFEDTIIKQYEKRKEIFRNRFAYENILPDFKLYTVKAVQSLGGQNDEYKDWFEAYKYMLEKIRMIDFDICILGCGAYGLPLAAEVKRMGKKAVHLGGATQLLFGIKGARWDNSPLIKSLVNDSWVRPLEEEKPKCAKNIEDSCYW